MFSNLQPSKKPKSDSAYIAKYVSDCIGTGIADPRHAFWAMVAVMQNETDSRLAAISFGKVLAYFDAACCKGYGESIF